MNNALEIKKMTRMERLQAMEALWDSLIEEESEIESPLWKSWGRAVSHES